MSDIRKSQPVEVDSASLSPRDLPQLIKQALVSGSCSVLEFFDTGKAPSEDDIKLRADVCKKLLKRYHMVHTVIIRMGCHISIFRNTRKANSLSITPGEGWYLHPNGFLLLWGSQQIPQTALPTEIDGIPVSDWEESLSLLLAWLQKNTDIVLL